MLQQSERGHAEGHAECIAIGESLKLKKMVQKKLEKGKSIDEIVDALEEDVEVIKKLIEEIRGSC